MQSFCRVGQSSPSLLHIAASGSQSARRQIHSPHFQQQQQQQQLCSATITSTTSTHVIGVILILHCKKYPYIDGYFVASLPYFNGTGFAYTFVSVNRRRKLTDGPIQTYTAEPVQLKYWKIATKYPSIYGYFCGVYIASSRRPPTQVISLCRTYRRRKYNTPSGRNYIQALHW